MSSPVINNIRYNAKEIISKKLEKASKPYLPYKNALTNSSFNSVQENLIMSQITVKINSILQKNIFVIQLKILYSFGRCVKVRIDEIIENTVATIETINAINIRSSSALKPDEYNTTSLYKLSLYAILILASE